MVYPTPVVAAALRQLVKLVTEREAARRALVAHDERIRASVARLRLDGANWGQIGGALGISRQGARQRFDLAARATRRTRDIRTDAAAASGGTAGSDA